ncbi:phage portal protein [Clostridium perfringens]|uniref:phage portal protein n=1 Tax=Clostridium perfringens TaxID=1502 RepID=UPI002902FB5E|nr:phage portal protein [Clostridium perfringens]MDM0487628.1 phage portal protein [Clostridium perfringens]MDU2073128.1 phage portal protein [Cutibacterium avidum]MDU8975591.1 phage portal protein [Clostridium perfringens]
MYWDRLEKRSTEETLQKYTFGELLKNGFETEDNALKESTYFKCIKYISESVAKCPIILKQDTEKGELEAYKHKLHEKLRLRPNPYMNAVDCIKTLVALGEHYGISGLYIDRKTMDLYPAKIEDILIDNLGLIKTLKKNATLYNITVCGSNFDVKEEDLCLYKSGISFDGLKTKSNRSLLTNIINTNIKSSEYLNKLFDNGLTNKILVQLTSDIKDNKKLKETQEKFDKLYSSNGRTFTVPAGYSISSLNLSLADAQFEQLRKLSRREIANCFGLSPAQINDLSDSNNNNMEMQNLGFLADTLLIKFQQIEQELDWKYLSSKDRENGFKCRFNQSVMLRTDAKTQAEIICKYLQNGAYSINNAKRILGMSLIDGGDSVLVPSGYYKLDDLSKITLLKAQGGVKSE